MKVADILTKGTLAFISTEGKFVKKTVSRNLFVYKFEVGASLDLFSRGSELLWIFPRYTENSPVSFLWTSINKDARIEIIRQYCPFRSYQSLFLAFTTCRSDNCCDHAKTQTADCVDQG